MRNLYHFTSRHHLPLIMEAGRLDVTESNIGCPPQMADMFPGTTFRSVGDHVGPDVVWLFDTPFPSLRNAGQMLRSAVDKRLVRITVSVPTTEADAGWWPRWSAEQGIDRPWYQVLAKAGDPREWYVVERPLVESEWVAVEQRDSLDSSWLALDFPAQFV